MRVLITGATGFVGRQLQRAFADAPDVWLAARSVSPGPRSLPLDITQPSAVAATLAALCPHVVVHLAAISQAGTHTPSALAAVNVEGAAHVADAAWSARSSARLLVVSTGYVYGETPHPAAESAPLRPVGLYASTKAEMEQVVGSLGRSRDLCVLRPFNHTGPHQSARYAVPAFADQIARLERSGGRGVLPVGDLSAVRDFSDVARLATVLRGLVQAESVPRVLNVCSGIARTLGDVLHDLLARSSLHSAHVRVESNGTSVLRRNVGDPHRLQQWAPSAPIPWSDTLDAILVAARARVSPEAAERPPAAREPGPGPAPARVSGGADP